jgi:tetratricopeptide (TPR) repeat protein
MTDNRHGQVVTFYSFKGGTGRTMALANVAWILAANGKRVLVVDWDLESPGLHRFFAPFIPPDALASNGGVIDLIRAYEVETTREVVRPDDWHTEYARVKHHAFSLQWDGFPPGGGLDFLSAGHQNNDYAVSLHGLDWDNFYDQLGGGHFLDALRSDMKRHYDYTLIDSRTGLSDVADICTLHLPDLLIDCFTFSEQGIEGAAAVARAVGDRGRGRIRVLPVPMRLDAAEKDKLDTGRAVAMQRFDGLPTGMTAEQTAAYWNDVQVPYQAFYAYEETLATFGDTRGAPMLTAYERLTDYLTLGEVKGLPPMDDAVRQRTKARFRRHLYVPQDEVNLRYAPEDQVWAEWVERVLRAAGVTVREVWAHQEPGNSKSPARELTIISRANVAEESVVVPRTGAGSNAPLAVYVADIRELPGFPAATSAFISGLSPHKAAEALIRLVGRAVEDVDVAAVTRGLRFPAEENLVFNVPARNVRFTGRDADLRRLRNQLRAQGSTVVLGAVPVALHGMGGIGKTQVAMEYAHRYRAAYDVVWWVESDPVDFIDVSITDLGRRLKLPVQPNIPDDVAAVLHALERGEPNSRWLLIFDNAEQIEKVAPFLPKGSTGHVLLTSRNPSWAERSEVIEVDVFHRDESIAHLRRRVPTMKVEDAYRVAEVLGDLPIAIAAAGAWIADTGTSVEAYLSEMEAHGGIGGDKVVEATWDLSLQRLRDQSPAAYRLLQLCSVMASEIALELIYSDEMAHLLLPYDRSLAVRSVLGKLVQQINRLALLKLDREREISPAADRSGISRTSPGRLGQIHVHRLLQFVVRKRMTPEEQNEAKHQVHVLLAKSRPNRDVDDAETWGRYRQLWPHLEQSSAVICEDEGVRGLLIDRVRYIWLLGGVLTGRELAEQVDAAWSQQLENERDQEQRAALLRQLLHLRFQLSNILRDQSEFEAAHEMDTAVRQRQEVLLGPDHPYTLMTAGGLAADLRGLGRYREALDLDTTTYTTWAQNYGDDYPRTLMALNNLASSYRLVGDYRAALAHDQDVFQRRKLVLGDDHHLTIFSAANLGRDMREAGDYAASVSLLAEVAENFVRLLGPESKHALNARVNLAVSLRSAGRASEATAHLDTAYDHLQESFGVTSPDALGCRLSRAVNLLSIGDVERAELELEAVRRSYLEVLGPEHPHTLVCLNNLAAVARAGNQRDRAVRLADDAARLLRQRLGVNSDGLAHPYTLAALSNLAICLAEAHQLEAALAPAQQVVAELEQILSAGHPDALRAAANLALIRRHLGAPTASAELDAIHERLALRVGGDHPAARALGRGDFLHRVIDPHPF